MLVFGVPPLFGLAGSNTVMCVCIYIETHICRPKEFHHRKEADFRYMMLQLC